MEAEIRELMCYLWDNYLQLYDADKIFIMGIGYAYIGIKMLLLNRSDASPPGKFPLAVIELVLLSCPLVSLSRVAISVLSCPSLRPLPPNFVASHT